jgi:hypothetical protein
MDERVPDEVLASIAGRHGARQASCRAGPVTGSSGAATGDISLLTGVARLGTADVPFRVVRKTVRPVTTGRHAPYAGDPEHWAYWRLGAWQATAAVPDAGWLARDQLGQRIAASHLDWSEVDADPRMVTLWQRRAELLSELGRVPRVLVHGDFSAGNIIAVDDRTTVVLDWATLGTGPAGADLASLALSTRGDFLGEYLAGLNGRFARPDAELGYRATLALTGASRVHWMLSQGAQPPAGYVEFVASQAP